MQLSTLLVLLVVGVISTSAWSPHSNRATHLRSVRDLSSPAQNSCPTFSCVDTYSTCSTTFSLPSAVVTSELLTQTIINITFLPQLLAQTIINISLTHTYCNYNNWCNSTSYNVTSTEQVNTGECLLLPDQIGQDCSGPHNCASTTAELDCNPTTLKCEAYVVTLSPGEQCQQNQQCSFTNLTSTGVVTTNTFCTAATTCYFVPDGSACSFSSQCNSLTSFCNATCQPYTPIGGACPVNARGAENCNQTCIPNSVNATGLGGTCQVYQILSAGQPCVDSTQCLPGLFCGDSSPSDIWGVCTVFNNKSSTLGLPCTSDFNCTRTNSEYCGCNSAWSSSGSVCLSTTFPVEYYTLLADLEQCEATHGCDTSSINCALNSCTPQLCSCILNYSVYSKYIQLGDDCWYTNVLLPKCTAQTSTAATGVVGTTTGPSGTTGATPTGQPTNPPSNSTSQPTIQPTIAPGGTTTDVGSQETSFASALIWSPVVLVLAYLVSL